MSNIDLAVNKGTVGFNYYAIANIEPPIIDNQIIIEPGQTVEFSIDDDTKTLGLMSSTSEQIRALVL